MPLKITDQLNKIDTEVLKEIEADMLARLSCGIEVLEGESENEFADRKKVWARCMANFLKLVRYAIGKKTFAYNDEVMQ